MRKVKIIVVFSILICTFLSCSNGFLKDPRLYNPKRASSQTVAPEPELQLTGGVDPFDKIDEWYNNPNSNGDEDDKGKVGFSAEEFNQIQITGWFSDKNVPTYTMTKGDVWKEGDATKREYVHSNAPSTEGQGWSITGVTYYQYRGINPGYAADGNYNARLQVTSAGKPKLSRFYFYRFTGKGGGVQWLDNNLIAVDTYSKLVFAFSEPVEFSSMGAPTKWDPTDNEAFYGTTYQFYMYDPVGYVLKKDDGSYEIQLYQWFQDSLASGNYKANINTEYSTIAEKDKNKPGKSPFNSHDVNFFEENMKLLAGKTFMYREKTENGGNSLNKVIYTISSDGTKLTKKNEVWNGLEEAPADEIYTIGQDESSSATKGSLSGGDNAFSGFEVKDEGKTIVFNNGVTASTQFQDDGPDFIERVKHNPVYKNGNISYTFSEGGKKLVYVSADNETYEYEFRQQESDTERYKGVYWTDDAIASWMGIGYGGVALYDSDFRIKVTNTSAGGAGIVDWLIMKDEAFLEQEAKTTFIDNVKNRSFSLREKNDDGFDVNLLTYSFDSNGNATFTRTPWQRNGESSTYTVTDGSDQKSGFINGEDASLDTTGTNWTLSIGGKVYTQGYIDNGPSFLNRVKGAIYSRGDTRYEFSPDGRKLTLSYKKLVWESWLPGYKVVTNSYIYDEGSDKDNVIATYGGFRVQLTQNDTVINMATVPNVGDASVMEYGADRQN